MDCFKRTLSLPLPLAVYIDRKHAHYVIDLVKRMRPEGVPFTRIVPIDQSWLEKNIHAFSPTIAKREASVMRSDSYRKRTQHRRGYPEHEIPAYNLINHAKIDFVMNAVEQPGMPQFAYYSWIDFGYLSDPRYVSSGCINTGRINPDAVTIMTVNPPDPRDGDPLYTLVQAPEKFAGGFFIGSKRVLSVYQREYHSALQRLHEAGIADDDQAVIANLFYHSRDPVCQIEWHPGGFKGALLWITS